MQKIKNKLNFYGALVLIFAAFATPFFSNSSAANFLTFEKNFEAKNAMRIYDAEFRSVSCDSNYEILENCEIDKLPSLQKKCTGVFYITAKIAGDVKVGNYVHLPFYSIEKLNYQCLPNPQKHLFFAVGDQIRIYQNYDDEISFRFLDEFLNDENFQLPPFERVFVENKFPRIYASRTRQLFNYFAWRQIISDKTGVANPTKKITRAEILTILTRVFKLQNDAEKTKAEVLKQFPSAAGNLYFSDVSADSWYAPFVAVGLRENWVHGFDNGTFRPANNLNYAEMLQMIFNAFKIEVKPFHGNWILPLVVYAQQIPQMPLLEPATEITRKYALEIIYATERFVNSQKTEIADL